MKNSKKDVDFVSISESVPIGIFSKNQDIVKTMTIVKKFSNSRRNSARPCEEFQEEGPHVSAAQIARHYAPCKRSTKESPGRDHLRVHLRGNIATHARII